MLKTIAKTIAYKKAPRTTFGLLHPRKAMRLKKVKYDLRHAYAPRLTALGAAVLALPLGYLLGRSGNGDSDSDEPQL